MSIVSPIGGIPSVTLPSLALPPDAQIIMIELMMCLLPRFSFFFSYFIVGKFQVESLRIL